MTTILDFAKNNNLTTVFSGLGGLRGNSEVHEVLKAIQEGELIVAHSPEYEAYQKSEKEIFDKAFYCLPADKNTIKVHNSNYYNIKQKGYMYLYEAMQEIGKLLYSDWEDEHVFLQSPAFSQCDDPYVTSLKIKIIYDTSRRSFLFHALDTENKTQLKQYIYETYQGASKANDFANNTDITFKSYKIYKNLIDNIITLDIKCDAIISDKENDDLPNSLVNSFVSIPENEWLTKSEYPESRIICHKGNKILLGVIDIYLDGDTYKGITLIKKQDVDQILAALKLQSHNKISDNVDTKNVDTKKEVRKIFETFLSDAKDRQDTIYYFRTTLNGKHEIADYKPDELYSALNKLYGISFDKSKALWREKIPEYNNDIPNMAIRKQGKKPKKANRYTNIYK